MAALDFPDPDQSQVYIAAGIKWTWNDTLKVWSSEAPQEPASQWDDVPNGISYTGGNVGIANADPEATLTIGNFSDTHLFRMRAGNTNISGIDFGDQDGADVGRIRYHHDDDKMRLTAGNTETVVLHDGHVGIGSAYPLVALDTFGTAFTSFTNSPFIQRLYTTNDSAQNIGGGISFGGKWNGS